MRKANIAGGVEVGGCRVVEEFGEFGGHRGYEWYRRMAADEAEAAVGDIPVRQTVYEPGVNSR